MRFFVGITDRDWFDHLSAIEGIDEVNFWQPSGSVQFRALHPGEPFLFKLHSPDNYIVGGGFFGYFTILPVSFAWKTFGEKNGARTEYEMRRRIEQYRRVTHSTTEDYEIGCILLESPFFFPRSDWIPTPDWPSSIVRGKGFDSQGEGRAIWDRVSALLSHHRVAAGLVEVAGERFGQPQLILPRLGQGSFRVIVTDSYNRRCAFTHSPVLHVLDAAHIRPYAEGGTHSPTNGILLRQDLHTLFDRGYMTVTPEHRVEVSRRIKDEFNNGKEYYALHGQAISLPTNDSRHPDKQALIWHNERVYQP